jgi:hypothetical protein
MSPLVGVCGETGDVLALRARGGNAHPARKGNAHPARKLPSFVDECVAAIPPGARPNYQLWLRVDSAGFSKSVVEAAVKHSAAFSITCKQNSSVRKAIAALATDPETNWVDAKDADGELAGSEVAETICRVAKRDLRLIVRRQRKATGEQLSCDDLRGWRFSTCPHVSCARRVVSISVFPVPIVMRQRSSKRSSDCGRSRRSPDADKLRTESPRGGRAMPLVTFERPFRASQRRSATGTGLHASVGAQIDHPVGLCSAQCGLRLPGCNIRVRLRRRGCPLECCSLTTVACVRGRICPAPDRHTEDTPLGILRA